MALRLECANLSSRTSAEGGSRIPVLHSMKDGSPPARTGQDRSEHTFHTYMGTGTITSSVLVSMPREVEFAHGRRDSRNFPGGPGVETLQGLWVPSVVGELRSCMLHDVAKKEKGLKTAP